MAGCFAYAPVSDGRPLPARGAAVRVHLTQPESFRLSTVTADRIVEVQGEVVEWNLDRLSVSAWWLRSVVGTEHRAIGETLVIPRGDLARLEHKRFSIHRSVGLTGVLLIVTILVNSAFEGGGGEPPPPPPPPPL